jgi:2-polyprenyl-6-methoxyphenol hydroxylase-like FAD-dependent oxidoreductase
LHQCPDVIRCDVLIVGGGFTGLAAAAALANGRRRIVVLEARTGPDPRFRGELIHPPGVRDLETLGFLAEMKRRGGTDVLGFTVLPDGGRPAVQLPYDPPHHGGGLGYALDHHLMVDAMREVVGRLPGLEIMLGQRVTEVLREGGRVAGVTTGRGVEARANLTVVAEGRGSRLRGRLGLEGASRLLSYTVALLAEGAELPYPRYGHVVLGAPGPVLAYPIGSAIRFCVDVPVDTGRGRDEIARRLREEYVRALPPALADALLSAIDARDLELCASLELHTDRCVVPGAALVGDAGGCSHPITAMGMTTSLHDVQTLRLALQATETRAQIDEALRRYEQERYRYVRTQELLTERLYEVFLGSDDGLRALREGMLEYWRRTARARVASMELLAGEPTATSTFAREYASVVAYAVREALRRDGPHGKRPLASRLRILPNVARVAWHAMHAPPAFANSHEELP